MDCINLKHRIHDLINDKVVTLDNVVANDNINPLSNRGSININMIETNDDGCMTKMIVLIARDELETVQASLSIK